MKIGTLLASCMLLALVVPLMGQEVKDQRLPKSPAARNALRQYSKNLSAADEAWRQSKIQALRTYLEDLDKAMQLALTAKNVEEIKALDEETKKAKEDLTQVIHPTMTAAAAIPENFHIKSDQDWQLVGKVRKGWVLAMKSTGQWKGSATESTFKSEEGDSQGNGKVQARIGTRIYPVGKEATITVDQDEDLYMRQYDHPGKFADNVGSAEVTITKTK